jgi:membrane protein YdbS with pleckstrin-like domain
MSEESPPPTDPSARRHHKHHLRTPSPELSHNRKLLRESLHRTIVIGVLALILAVTLVVVVTDLNSWASWVVLIAICVTVVGAIIAISPTRRA